MGRYLLEGVRFYKVIENFQYVSYCVGLDPQRAMPALNFPVSADSTSGSPSVMSMQEQPQVTFQEDRV